MTNDDELTKFSSRQGIQKVVIVLRYKGGIVECFPFLLLLFACLSIQTKTKTKETIAGKNKMEKYPPLVVVSHKSTNANATSRHLWPHHSVDGLWPNGAYQTRQSLDLCALSPDVLVLLSNLCSQGLNK